MEWETEPLCKLLNKALKSDRQDELKPWLPYLQLFRAGVERLPSFKGVCWRGTNKNIGSKFTRGSSSSSSSKHDTNQISSMKSTDEYKETQASPKSKFDDNQNVAHASA
ncbi:unnamed protein product, partial [Rotaria sp. Silwood1]